MTFQETGSDENGSNIEQPESAAEEQELAPSTELTSSESEPVTSPEAPVEPVASTPETPVEPKRTARFQRGDLVSGKIVQTTPTQVTVELGPDEIGIIPARELERMSRQMIDELKADAEISVYVVNPSDHEGRIILSRNRAMEELDWQQAEQYRESQEPYEGKVAGYNKGGLIVRFGRLRGFVPRSQISEDRLLTDEEGSPDDRYGRSVNEPIIVKVTEVDRARNRLILSERAALRETREKRKEDLISRLHVGQVVTGRVVSLEEFGAFVDIGGAEGLVHTTEITWKHINRPDEVLRKGQEVKVEVISIDSDRKRIGLSMKRQEIDPWDEVATTYEVGQLVQGTITKLTKFGAFARLVDAPDIEGLIHISELSEQRVNHPKEVVREGDKLTLRVVKVDVKNRRLGLSLKRVSSAEYLDRDMQNSFGMAGAPQDDSASEAAAVTAYVAGDNAPEDSAPVDVDSADAPDASAGDDASDA